MPPLSDRKLGVSKVKPRKDPVAQCSSSTTLPCGSVQKDKLHCEIPPPIPISTIQSIGTNLCGMRPNQLSNQKLLSPMVAQEKDSDVLNPDA